MAGLLAARSREVLVSGCGRAGPEGGHAEADGAVLADDGDCFAGAGAFGGGQLGDGVGAGPVVDAADGGGEPFPGAEQVVEGGGQVGQVGDVGAEVVAAGAAEPDGAGAAARPLKSLSMQTRRTQVDEGR
jgi:hypothetical protein